MKNIPKIKQQKGKKYDYWIKQTKRALFVNRIVCNKKSFERKSYNPGWNIK